MTKSEFDLDIIAFRENLSLYKEWLTERWGAVRMRLTKAEAEKVEILERNAARVWDGNVDSYIVWLVEALLYHTDNHSGMVDLATYRRNLRNLWKLSLEGD